MTRAMKCAVIAISSSSSSEEEEEEEEEEETSTQESEDSDSSYGDSVNEFSSSTCLKEDSEDDDDEESEGKDEESSSCRPVVQLLKESCDIQVLTVMESKAYLRRHGLRLSGTRAECIQRIKEHWRLKDGNGEVLYPRSTFSINCTGDVCRGDVVLFNQKVYKKFDKASRRGRFSGKRWVAGRVIKESYGAAKQQHTFTVEVLWSNGVDKLPVLYPLLIKGRNLYRMKTFRQRWKDENQRAKVLAEKHKRGDAARSVRDTRWAKSANKRKRNASTNHKGRKRQKIDQQHTQYTQNVRPFVVVAKKVVEHTKPAKQKEIVCKQKVTTKKTSKLCAHISHPKQVEKLGKSAKQKEIICTPKVTTKKTRELSGHISHPDHTDQHPRTSQNVKPFVEVAKQVEEHTKLAKQKEICKQKVQTKKVYELSGPISHPKHTDQHTQSSQNVTPVVEGAKKVDEHRKPAKQKEICKQKVTPKKKSELSSSISHPKHTKQHSRSSQNVRPFVEVAKKVEEHTKPAKAKQKEIICKQKVTMKKTSELSGLISHSKHTDQHSRPSQNVKSFVEVAKKVEEHRKPAKQEEISTPKVMPNKTSELNGHISHPFEVGRSLSQPLAFPRHPTSFPQNHLNHVPPNFFSSSGPFSNGGFPGLHPRPVFSPYGPFSNGGFLGMDPRFVNFDNRKYPPRPFQETVWRNPSMNIGRGAYFEKRGYHPYY